MARALLLYLDSHRLAKDSLNGIYRFWLPDAGSGWRLSDLEDVLDHLVAIEALTETEVAGSRVYALGAVDPAELADSLQEDAVDG